jgi:hypothetical protein
MVARRTFVAEASDNGGLEAGSGTESSSAEQLDPKVVSRRDALKKAAIGAGIAGAVWSAPRIEGLSLVPDYAAAGTIPPGSTITIKVTAATCSTAFGNNTNCWGNCVRPALTTCAPFQFHVPAYAPAAGTGIAGNPPTPTPLPFFPLPGTPGTGAAYNSTTMLTNPAPPAPNQNEFFDVVWSGNADENSMGSAKVMFSLDPPFNMCTATATGRTHPASSNTTTAWPSTNLMTTNHPGTVPTPAGPVPAVTGADVTFNLARPPGTPTPQAVQGSDVTITITCT